MTHQPTLFDMGHPDQPPMRFDGTTINPALDTVRLGRALQAVKEALSDGTWWTLAELAARCQCSEAGVSARLRDLRKARFGGHNIEAERCGTSGLWRYRLGGVR